MSIVSTVFLIFLYCFHLNLNKTFLLKSIVFNNNSLFIKNIYKNEQQVQLLVSDSDVESYKQIKHDLDILRQSVEKSELWVYKSKTSEELATSKF